MGVGKDCLRTDGPFLRNSRSETFNKHVNTLNVPVSLKRSDVAVDFLTSYEQTLFLSDIISNDCGIDNVSDENGQDESDLSEISDTENESMGSEEESTLSYDSVNENDINLQFKGSREGLSLYYTNADYLLFKLDELKVRIELISPDILIITEIYPKTEKSTNITAEELQIENYTLYRSNVMDNSRGVAIYVKDNISSTLNTELTNHIFSESVWVNIQLSKTDTFLVGGVYRSPQSNYENNDLLLDLLHKAKETKFSNVLVLGDFNMPEINWELWTTSKSENHISYKFLECLRDNFWEQTVVSPTRWVNDQPGNVLDLCVTNNSDIIKNIEITTRLGSSDHLSIEIELTFPRIGPHSYTEKRNYYKGDYVDANIKLSDINWSSMLDMDLEASWQFFSEHVNHIVNETIPIHKEINPKKPKPPWMDKYCLKLVEEKYKAWKKYSYSRNREHYLDYCRIRNRVTRSVRYAKRKFERGISLEVKENPKSFWKYVRSKTKTRTGISDLKNDKGEWITNDKDKATELNEFFSSVFTKEEDDELPDFSSKTDSSISDIVVTETKVKSLLKALNVSKSTGPDNFHPRFLKETADNISYPIMILFNKSLSEGILPSDWKLANVTSIFKSGDKTKSSNYRPISITSILCRMLESIIKNAVMEHCKDNNIFTDAQFGFRERRGCILQLLTVFDSWSKYIDSDVPVDTVFLDFRKAFDSVPHKRLLLKLEKLGISGNVLKWIENFLSNRLQRVVINGQSSEWTDVSSGVPQGSVLGPLLFIMFVNDLPEEVDSYCRLFADDAKLYKDLQNLEDFDTIQNDLNKLCQWTIKWLMLFNVDKCKVMHIGKDNPRFEYEMTDRDGNTKVLKSVELEKDLGVHVQENLKFDKHISLTVNKANRLVGLIKRAFSYLDEETLLILYKTIIRPIIDYGNTVWFPMLKKDIRALENVQRRLTRLLPELAQFSYEDRLRMLNLTTLQYRRYRMDMIQVFKIIHNIDDVKMEDFFEFSDLNTRGHSKKLVKPRALKSFRQNSFCVRVIDKWNALPDDMVNTSTVLSFKTMYDRYMGDQKYQTGEIY